MGPSNLPDTRARAELRVSCTETGGGTATSAINVEVGAAVRRTGLVAAGRAVLRLGTEVAVALDAFEFVLTSTSRFGHLFL